MQSVSSADFNKAEQLNAWADLKKNQDRELSWGKIICLVN